MEQAITLELPDVEATGALAARLARLIGDMAGD